MTRKFNQFRFSGLDYHVFSNKYWTMHRVSEDESKIVVKVADCHLFPTQYGYGLILDRNHVAWLKDWAVSANWYGCEIMLDKNYFKVVDAKKPFDDFGDGSEGGYHMTDWNWWLETAKEQEEAGNHVMWAK